MKFAKERVSLIQQYAAKEKAGRAALIRETLDEYTKIIDAIDTVTDDALRRGRSVEKGLAFVTSGERDLLEALRRVAKSAPSDMAIYKFSLEQAIGATSDSLDLALDDLGSRSADLKAKDEKERKAREAVTSPDDVRPSAPRRRRTRTRRRKLRRCAALGKPLRLQEITPCHPFTKPPTCGWGEVCPLPQTSPRRCSATCAG